MARILCVAVFVLLLSSGLSGCGGGGAKNYNITRSTTVGQELKDLKEARDRGAISADEYEELREKIIKGKED